ncbi:hypothetical protein [Nakamurella sp.]|uniref:hypothetical protein n=1 Tax=Nakamurella sp. TaxID=1869182 RepID=UPI003782DDEE
MNDERIAEVVRAHLLEDGLDVVAVEVRHEGFEVVTTGWTWLIDLRFQFVHGDERVAVYDAQPDLIVDPGVRCYGLAVSRGSSYLLNDPDQLGAFWSLFGRSIGAPELMGVIERYQGTGAPAHLVLTKADLERRVGNPPPSTLARVSAPAVEVDDRGVALTFFAWGMNPTGRTGSESLKVIQWDVRGVWDGTLRWSNQIVDAAMAVPGGS